MSVSIGGVCAGVKAFRAPEAASVGDDQPPHAGEPAQEASKRGIFPRDLEVRDASLQIEQVERATADYLVGERDFAVPCVPDLGAVHQHEPSVVGPFSGRVSCER
jgi:hypothetical protein